MTQGYCKITEDTFIGGEPVAKGDEIQVDEATLKQLVRCKRAVPCEAPASASAQKAKFTKVEK